VSLASAALVRQEIGMVWWDCFFVGGVCVCVALAEIACMSLVRD